MAAKSDRRPLRLESLDERALPSVSMIETDGTLVIRGDRHANDISITDDGTANAGNVVVVADGQTFTSSGAIANIRVLSGGGADNVRYELTGDLSGPRDVSASLGDLYRAADSFASEQTRERPHVALGVAAGVGFVLGGGLASRLGGTLLSVGTRLVATRLLEEWLSTDNGK